MFKNFDFKILQGENISDKLFGEFFDLLKDSMKKNEYRSYEKQKNLLKNNIYKIMFCFNKNKTVGIMAFWEIDDFIFIEHFAINKELRGHGIGTEMIKYILKQFNNNVILEVELPYNRINERRIAFYERNGFFYNDFEYYQIPLNKGDDPLPLKIMSYPKPISQSQFKTMVKTLQKAVYKY